MKTRSAALNFALAISAVGMAAALPALALTPPAMTISDGTNTVTIDATGVPTCVGTCTTSNVSGTATNPGSVSWMGTLGNFSISTAQGQSKSANFPGYPDIAVVAQNTGSTQGTLTVTWSDVGYTGGPVDVDPIIQNTFSNGTGSAVYTYYTDNTNALFGKGSVVGLLSNVLGSLLSSPSWATGTNSGSFSATEVEAITMAAGTDFNGDNQMDMYNEPITVSCAVSSGVVGTAYSSSVSAAGGTGPYTFALAAGSLPAGLTLNATSGLITGTPTAAGTFSYTIVVTDSVGYLAESVCGMTIALGGGGGEGGGTPSLTLTCPSSSATQSTQYSSSFVAAGGLSPYTFSISAGKLPAGLTLTASTGALTGKAKTAGTYTFTGTVVDSTKPTALTATSGTCTMTVAPAPPPLTLSCATNSGTTGTAYSSAVVAKGGTPPYASYKLTAGSLPTGLTLNTTTGAITGTPTKSGSYSYTIEVKDANGAITTDGSGSGRCSSQGCNITIASPPPVSVKCPTGNATVGTAYSSSAVAAGGTAPYTFALSQGSLPPGLALNATSGAVTGTPTTPGTSNFTITVTDASGKTTGSHTCSGGCQIVVAPSITVSNPPTQINHNQPCNGQVTASGGKPPYTYSINSGSLPHGLTLNCNTGVISGTPDTNGTWSVSFKATDSKGDCGVTYSGTGGGGDTGNNGNNGFGQQGWGGDDNSNANAQCVTQITVCDPSQNNNYGGGQGGGFGGQGGGW